MSMYITSLSLINFRCFKSLELRFEAPLIIIEGQNGAGKTSLLEALHYACYLRSFRTAKTQEMIAFDQQNFFIKILNAADSQALSIGFSPTKRQVKLQEKLINSYKELINFYRVITILEDDILLIKGNPEERRAFLDQALFLMNPSYTALLQRYKNCLKQRNSYLQSSLCDESLLAVWTDQLIELSLAIRAFRTEFLHNLTLAANKELLEFFGPEFSLNLIYEPKEFSSDLLRSEKILKRTRFGAHVDDFHVILHARKSRTYASRGQQKLLVMALKIAQLKLLNKPALILIDDFMTDFDSERIQSFLKLLISLEQQIIFTCPTSQGILANELTGCAVQRIVL